MTKKSFLISRTLATVYTSTIDVLPTHPCGAKIHYFYTNKLMVQKLSFVQFLGKNVQNVVGELNKTLAKDVGDLKKNVQKDVGKLKRLYKKILVSLKDCTKRCW